MPDQSITLSISDGTTMQAYVSMPEGNGPFPGILVLQEAFGVNSHIRNISDRLAAAGYVVVAPELFHRTAPPGFETGYTDMSVIAPHFAGISEAGLTADMQAAFDWLQQQPNVKRDKIGSIGFCLGGRASFLANAALPLSAAVSYYGGRTTEYLSKAESFHAPHLFFWGGLDKHIPAEQVDAVIDAVKKAGKKYVNVVFSDADHGFNCDERAAYNPKAASEAWALTMAFLKNNL